MSLTRLIVFCYLPGKIKAVPAGLFEHDSDSGVGIFRYGLKYQERSNAIPVDLVALPLGVDIQPVKSNNGLYGAFRDASPDYWGRLVIAAGLKCPVEAVSEVDYLLAANATRVGNLDFRKDLDEPEPELRPPQFHDIKDLLNAACELEQGHPVNDRIRLLLEQGSSLGGARPKCTIELDGELWLAKFPSKNDSISIPRMEYATMRLASECGLNVPEVRFMPIGEHGVFLIRRFDRMVESGGWIRRGFISALSFAEWDERDRTGWSYKTVAERIRKYSVAPEEDLHELFMRIAFNILVHNTDDHPRNHGFLYEKSGVSLSPLFDVVPTLTRYGVGSEFYLAMGIGREGRLASLDNLCSVAPAFNFSIAEAKEITADMKKKVLSLWGKIFYEAGFNENEMEILAPSFEEEKVK